LLQFKGKLTAENVLDLMMAKALTFFLFLPLQQSHHESRYLKKKKNLWKIVNAEQRAASPSSLFQQLHQWHFNERADQLKTILNW
jgi:hypothetical protein